MNEPALEHLETRLKETAAAFEYPPTPDIAAGVRRRLAAPKSGIQSARRWAVAAAIALLICLLAITAVPPARAALLKFLQIGAVRINLLPESQAPLSEPQPLSILNLGEPLTLDEAGAIITLRDPATPPLLGEPDAIYGQNLLYREPVISFLWFAAEDRPQILLTQIELPQFGLKWAAGEQILQTAVSGQPAVWIAGPHLFDLSEGRIDQSARMATNVLIWSAGDTTFRLEGDIPLAEARQIAESWP